MKPEQHAELNAWIEMHIFGKKCYSEMRGEYEFFYMLDKEPWNGRRNPEKEKENYKVRQWSEYNCMKHIIPDGNIRRFATSPADCALVRQKCLEKLASWGWAASIYLNPVKGYQIISGKMKAEAPTEEIAWSTFARQLFGKDNQ